MTNKTGRPISLEDVRLLLNGWRDSNVQILCQSQVGPTVFRMTGRLLPFTGPSNIGLISDDKTAEFAFAIKPDFRFVYADPRNFPDEAEDVEGTLFFFFPPTSAFIEDDDFISLSELKTM